jgi:hypothetical protein
MKNFTENTTKEELVLEHVLEFEKNFRLIYDPNRPLLIAPVNECEVKKFICSTIRPTLLPFTELYDWKPCAEFVSNFIEYEELEIPNQLPDYIPSPGNVLMWQQGDSFDFSIVLCSLLIGAGYDAYCVYGAAPKYITTKDESLMDVPFSLDLPEDKKDDDQDSDEEQMIVKEKDVEQLPHDFKFEIKPKEPLVSKFVEANLNEATRAEEERKWREVTIDDDAPDLEKHDELEAKKQRLHCWVLIKEGERGLTESFFVEPTTGRSYTFKDCPYQKIEAIFNHKNFWINLNPEQKIQELNMDFEGNIWWEYVMLTDEDQ